MIGEELAPDNDLLTLWVNASKLFDYQYKLPEAFANNFDREISAALQKNSG